MQKEGLLFLPHCTRLYKPYPFGGVDGGGLEGVAWSGEEGEKQKEG